MTVDGPSGKGSTPTSAEMAEMTTGSLEVASAESYSAIIWKRFRRHPAAIISSTVLIILILEFTVLK